LAQEARPISSFSKQSQPAKRRMMQLGFLLAAALVGQVQTMSITPAIKDGQSDKKFFSSNYPQDARPVVDTKILNKLKSDKEPYPALQSTNKFDTDFVKDENKDTGHWKAQFEYDALRKKMTQEEADEKTAADKAAKEGSDTADAQKKADDAAKKADDAKEEAKAAKDAEDAAKKKEGDAAGKKDDGSEKATEAEVFEAKRALAKAEVALEEQKKAFALCEKDLAETKANYEELKMKVAEMEQTSAADVKLWVEQSAAKRKSDAEVKAKRVEAASAKREAAELRVTAAENTKVHLMKILQKEKAESEQAQKTVQKQRAEKEQTKADLDKSAEQLQKLRGYAPDAKAPQPIKSGAAVPATLFSLLLSMAVLILF